jgi:hypothetical protein
MLHKLRIALAAILVAVAAVSAVDSASAKGGDGRPEHYYAVKLTDVLVTTPTVVSTELP